MHTYDLQEAAKLAHCHPDTLRKMAKLGEAPGTKIGRAWVFHEEVFNDWIKRKCQSIAVPEVRTGGYELPSLAERLAARLARQTASKRKNSNNMSGSDSGDFENSATVVLFAGRKSPSAG